VIRVRLSEERGQGVHDWLDARHTFSFANYVDSAQMGFGVLRVINEDRIAAGKGFPMHGHQDMEILTYIVDGALEHKDSMGNSAIIRPGEIQRMSAGRGVRHSEHNHEKERPTHLLQIWIEPERLGIEPGYEQKRIADIPSSGPLVLMASREGRSGSVVINQDVNVFGLRDPEKGSIAQTLEPGRLAWLQVIAGRVFLNAESLRDGDGAAVDGETRLKLNWDPNSQFILFDLPPPK
jgi:quercetin 2,3-dioxygenase